MPRALLLAALAAAPGGAVAAVIDWSGQPPVFSPGFYDGANVVEGLFSYAENGFDVEIDAALTRADFPAFPADPDFPLGFLNDSITGFDSVLRYTFTRPDGLPFSLEQIDIPSVNSSTLGSVFRTEIDPETGDFVGFVAQDDFFVTWDNVALDGITRDGGTVSTTFSAWNIAPGDEPIGNSYVNSAGSVFDAGDFGDGFSGLTSLTITANADADVCHPSNFGRPDPLVELEAFCTGAPFSLFTGPGEYDVFTEAAAVQNDATSMVIASLTLSPVPLPAGGLLLLGALGGFGALSFARGRA